MKTTTLFLITILYVTPMLLSVRISKDRFSEIQDQIKSFCDTITTEGFEANERYQVEKRWCEEKIQEAEELVAKRTKEVEALEEQKKGLEDKIDDNMKAIQHYQDKYNQNLETMARFKLERCDANFNFIKLLREHYDSEELLKQLRLDLDTYLDRKIQNPEDASAVLPSEFIEKVSSIAHMLPAHHQTSLVQILQSLDGYVQAGDVQPVVNDSIANRYDARVLNDTLHVDNTREELKALEHVKVINPQEYFMKLKAKIDNIIDGMLEHLSASKLDLSNKEMSANSDYAKFMIALDKENTELLAMIKRLEDENDVLNEELRKTNETLEEFRTLLQAAIDNLNYLRQICQEKEEYHTSEELRRSKETSKCEEAGKLFETIVGADSELKELINQNVDLTKSETLENASTYEAKRTDNKAEDIKIVF